MAYIPKEHEMYPVLPFCRKNGGEVFEYSSGLLRQVEEATGEALTPYGFDSYQEYFDLLDRCIENHKENAVTVDLLNEYKAQILDLNHKEVWSICRYLGGRIGEVTGLITGHVYYWPCSRTHPVFRGIIDEEEFTAYIFPTDPSVWEILLDPTGMARDTLLSNPLPRVEFDNIMNQLNQFT